MPRSGTKPNDVNGLWTARTMYYRDRLMRFCKGLIEIDVPDGWDLAYMLDLLLKEGSFVITESSAGVLPFRSGYSGVNYMNQPTKAIISVPGMRQMERTLDKDCVAIYLQKNGLEYGFHTVLPMVDVFAERLASADACIDTNLMNSRVAYLMEAETKAQAMTLKQAYSDVTNGEPLVILRKGTADSKMVAEGIHVFFNNLKNNYIANDVQDTKRSIMCEFLGELGINNANTDKKERLLTGEVDSNNDELACAVAYWKQNFEGQSKKVKEMFPGIGFGIKLRFDIAEEEKRQDAVNRAMQSVGVQSSGK